MAIVTTDDKHYKAIADAIREHGLGLAKDAYTPSEMAGGVYDVWRVGESVGHQNGLFEGRLQGQEEGVEIGVQQEYDRFWDRFQNYGKGKDAAYLMFAGYGWTDAIYNPKYPIKCGWSANQMYERSRITDTKVPIDMTSLTNNASNVFRDSNIHTTHLIVAETTPLRTTFTDATNLANLTIEGTIGKSINTQWCPLTADSTRCVVEHLSDTVTGCTATFNKAAKEAAFTQTEWDELIATKPNWTVSLI